MIAGRYTLEREIGRGGMGSVWLARDETLGRRVALKRVGLTPDGPTPGGPAPDGGRPDLVRAEREAKLAARLNHPHVVAVYDLVDDPTDGARWLVMEYVEGRNLAQLVDSRGVLPVDTAARLLAQASEALALAHEAGIVHRDVKPSNILVDDLGQVKLTDFGIARAEADVSLTRTGLVTGSPAYLAPEVATGSSATPASDVWSLGATLFHALEGRPPYDVGDNVVGALYRIAHEPPPRPLQAGWLTPLFAATMNPDPASRWTMREVQRFLVSGPTAATPPAPAATQTAYLPGHAPVAFDVAPSAPAGRTAPSRRALWPAIAGILVAVAIVLLGVRLLTGGDDPSETGAEPTPGAQSTRSPTQTPTATPSPTESAEQKAKAMEDFVRSYLALVTSDQKAAFAQLTPGYQAQSGGYGEYRRFWKDFRSAAPRRIEADPVAGTVRYRVDYVTKKEGDWSDEVQLRLQESNGTYLIAGES